MPNDSSEKKKRLSNDSVIKTLIVAISLCLVCSVVVSGAAVILKPIQEYNKELDRKRNILRSAGLLEEGKEIDELFKQIEPKIVDLATGEYVDTLDLTEYDQRRAAKDPSQSIEIPSKRDVAKIKRRAKYARVYLVKAQDRVQKIILPVHGAGLYSTLYAFLALEGDAKTVAGLSFYEQGETPGLGGEIESKRWLAKWPGKKVYDKKNVRRIEVIKGTVDPKDDDAIFQVDGISGATLTSRGVSKLLAYWLGDEGFRPFLLQIGASG